MSVTLPSGRKRLIKTGDKVTGVSALFGRVTIKVSSANSKSVRGYTNQVSPKTGMRVQGAVIFTPAEVRRGLKK